MKTKNKIYNVSEELNQVFGAHGTESRKEAERQAWEEYNAQILLDARKQSGMTQSELAEKTLAESLVMKCVVAVDWGAIVSWQKCV